MTEITNVQEFIGWITDICEKKNTMFGVSELFYRGQANKDWSILPYVFRTESDKTTGKEYCYNEIGLLRRAESEAYSSIKDCQNAVEKLVMLQHMGLPTRILDVTFNPLVALYFACSDESQKSGNGAVYYGCTDGMLNNNMACISAEEAFRGNVNALKKENIKNRYPMFFDGTNDEERTDTLLEWLQSPLFLHSPWNNKRIVAQQGAFIFPPVLSRENTELGFPMYPTCPEKVDFRTEKYNLGGSERSVFNNEYCEIPSSCKSKILKEMEGLGVSEQTLFPDKVDEKMKAIKRKESVEISSDSFDFESSKPKKPWKKFLLSILFILFAHQTFAQNVDMDYWLDYFSENILDLDPIEGIYDAQITTDEYNQYKTWPTEYDHTSSLIIYRSEFDKDVFLIEGLALNIGGKQYFAKIGETNVYNYLRKWPNAETTIVRVYLENGTRLAYQYRVPQAQLRHDIGSRAEGHVVMYGHTFIKRYPTQSMYKEAIAKAIEKIEEESKPKEWSGTGFALNNGYVVTNYHVVEDAKSIDISGINGDFYVSYTASIVATDKVNDLAIVKISDSRFKGFGTLPYAVDMQMAEVGDDVFVLGYPLTQTMGDEIKLTNGIISSRTGFQGDASLYQMSAPIQPGNSGGPMFNSKGNVVGIVCAHHKGTENVGYAIKTSYLKNLAESSSLTNIFPTSNAISSLPLSGQVKKVKQYVFLIKCSSQDFTHYHSTYSAPPSTSTVRPPQTRIKYFPSVTRCPSNLTVTSVTATGSYTAVEIRSDPGRYAWCSIDKDTYISVNDVQLKLVRAEGIAISPQVTYYNGNILSFTLYFPPISSTITQFDLIEPGNSNWKIYGIHLQ